MNIGQRLLRVVRTITTDPALVQKVDTIEANLADNDDTDEVTRAALEGMGTTTTQLVADFAEFRAGLEANGVLDTALTAKVDSMKAALDSLDEAFPDEDQGGPIEDPNLDNGGTGTGTGDGTGNVA